MQICNLHQRSMIAIVGIVAAWTASLPAQSTAVSDRPLAPVVVESVHLISDSDTAASPSDAIPPTIEPATPQPIVDPSASLAPCSCCNNTCCTKRQQQAATARMQNAYQGVFYANDFSYLDDRCYDGPSFCGDALKGIGCGRLDIGGEARVRYHSEDNHRGVGLTGLDDDFWLTRYRLFADYRVTENLRVYGEYLYADSAGEAVENRSIEENRGEIQNLFFDARLTDRTTLRLGRQELLYGSQRLVSPLDWANTRRTFEGGRLLYHGDTWNVDGFFTHPVNRTTENESKIDDANEDVDFFGVFASRGDLAIGSLDAYYLGLDDSILDFDYHTLGTRVYGQSDGGWLYEAEGGVQFGSNSPGYGDHSAGFVTAGLGRQLNVSSNWKPTVWLWYDWASGGDDIPAARGDDGFDQLFPLAHKYLGFMDLFGRRNINDVNAQLITPLLGSSKLNLIVWYHYFFLDQKTTPYSVLMTPFNPLNAAGDRELGHEIDVLLDVTFNARNSMLIGYSFFNAGDYYDTTVGVPTNQDAQFFYMQYQTRF